VNSECFKMIKAEIATKQGIRPSFSSDRHGERHADRPDECYGLLERGRTHQGRRSNCINRCSGLEKVKEVGERRQRQSGGCVRVKESEIGTNGREKESKQQTWNGWLMR
jgi:hypothetical protein